MGGKIHLEALDIPEQIDNLKKDGLIIDDEEYAKEVLHRISYYRLIKAYGKSFKDSKTGKYRKGTTFEKIFDVYEFDRKLRQLLMPYLQDIEITLRCQISNYFSVKYGVLGYLNSNNFDENCMFSKLEDKINQCIEQSKDSPIIKNFEENYVDGKVSLYAAIEVFTFGTLALFYSSMKLEDRKAIANMYEDVDESYLSSWLVSIGYVRNLCFHYNRLYKKIMIKRPRLYKKQFGDINNSYLYAVMCCMKYLCRSSEGWDSFVYALDDLFTEYSDCVEPYGIGCPKDGWKDILLDIDSDKNTPFNELLKKLKL